METMTEQRLACLEVEVFIYLCIYVQYVRVHVQVQYAFVGMGNKRRGGLNIHKA